jgi:hypothetical protein
MSGTKRGRRRPYSRFSLPLRQGPCQLGVLGASGDAGGPRASGDGVGGPGARGDGGYDQVPRCCRCGRSGSVQRRRVGASVGVQGRRGAGQGELAARQLEAIGGASRARAGG